MPTTINPTKYAIILLDKDGNVKNRLEHVASRVAWSWLTSGGCGRCKVTLPGNYDRLNVNPDDEIQIWGPNEDGTATKVYSGYAQDPTPVIGGAGDEKISTLFNGYGQQFKRIVVQDDGDIKTYASTAISDVVEDLIDTFITPNTSITKGTIDTSSYSPDLLEFKTSVYDALQTLADLENVEYGVDANKVFFWRNRGTSISHKFFLGSNVSLVEDRAEYNDIVNKLYLEGGKVNEQAFNLTQSSSRSITTYKLRERIESNGSIVTNSVGVRYLSRLLKREARPKIQRRAQVVNAKKRLESSLPINTVSIVDPDNASFGAIYGTTANGGSNKLYGAVAAGGSGQKYGADRSDLVSRIDYEFSPEIGRYNATIQFADTKSYSMASATLKRIENGLSATRQRQL